MPDFMLAYHGGKAPETEAEAQAAMAAWGAWFGRIEDCVKTREIRSEHHPRYRPAVLFQMAALTL